MTREKRREKEIKRLFMALQGSVARTEQLGVCVFSQKRRSPR